MCEVCVDVCFLSHPIISPPTNHCLLRVSHIMQPISSWQSTSWWLSHNSCQIVSSHLIPWHGQDLCWDLVKPGAMVPSVSINQPQQQQPGSTAQIWIFSPCYVMGSSQLSESDVYWPWVVHSAQQRKCTGCPKLLDLQNIYSKGIGYLFIIFIFRKWICRWCETSSINDSWLLLMDQPVGWSSQL